MFYFGVLSISFKPNCPNHTAVDAIKSRAVCPRFIWIWFKLTFFQVVVPVPRNTATASAFSSTWYSFAFQMFFLYLLSKRSYTFPFLESSTVYDVIGLGEIKYDTFISNIQSQRSELLGSVVTWHLWAFSVQIFNILTKVIYPQCCPNIKPEMAKSQISSMRGCKYCLDLYMAASLEILSNFLFSLNFWIWIAQNCESWAPGYFIVNSIDFSVSASVNSILYLK